MSTPPVPVVLAECHSSRFFRRPEGGAGRGAEEVQVLGLPGCVGIPPTPPHSGGASRCGSSPGWATRGQGPKWGTRCCWQPPYGCRPTGPLDLKHSGPDRMVPAIIDPSLHPFIHIFIQQIIFEHLLCARRCCKGLGHCSQDRQDYSPRAENSEMNTQ